MESFSSGLPGKMGTNAYSRQIGPGWQTREVSPFKSDRLNQRVYWGCLQSMGADLDAHEWLKGHCITPKPNPAWVATQARYILGAPCTACSPLDWSEESLCPRQVYHFHNLCVCVCGGGVPANTEASRRMICMREEGNQVQHILVSVQISRVWSRVVYFWQI